MTEQDTKIAEKLLNLISKGGAKQLSNIQAYNKFIEATYLRRVHLQRLNRKSLWITIKTAAIAKIHQIKLFFKNNF